GLAANAGTVRAALGRAAGRDRGGHRPLLAGPARGEGSPGARRGRPGTEARRRVAVAGTALPRWTRGGSPTRRVAGRAGRAALSLVRAGTLGRRRSEPRRSAGSPGPGTDDAHSRHPARPGSRRFRTGDPHGLLGPRASGSGRGGPTARRPRPPGS